MVLFPLLVIFTAWVGICYVIIIARKYGGMDLLCLTLPAHTSMLPKSWIYNRICYLPLFTSRLAAAHYTCCTPDNHQTGAMSIGTFKTTQRIKSSLNQIHRKKHWINTKIYHMLHFFTILYGNIPQVSIHVAASHKASQH